ncbi:MAG: hypothetical protein AB7U34_09600 [Novosphingobium sp.]
MIVRAGSGWQTVLADLSLILFIVAAAAVPNMAASRPDSEGVASARGEPMAIYSPNEGAPPLARWLAEQQADPRQMLTITAHYGAQGADQALARATALARDAMVAGQRVRVLIEPGMPGVSATLAYDVPGGEVR